MTGQDGLEIPENENEAPRTSYSTIVAWVLLFGGVVLGTWDLFFRDRPPATLTRFAFGVAAFAAAWLFVVALTGKRESDE